MARKTTTDALSIAAIVVGALLVPGALMFLLVVSVASASEVVSRLLFIPPVVQIVLGLLALTAGFFLGGNRRAVQYSLLLIAIRVVANVVFAAWLLLTKMG